ncbi:hypothetical protein EJD97_007896 [Solanum chilense]|uniref:WRKY domain-containing protein n=1 Tax=Solanum chilense TaxID=4083 RepID=A0A6N2BKQ1_SOLCI|nr:hypothetical protein EJD97_007896 [Solanum chilense]
MEDNDWDLSAVVRSCKIINKPSNVTASENDWYTFDKTLDFSVGREEKSNDQVVITNQNQEMYLHPTQPNQFSEENILPSLPTTMTTGVPTTTTATTPQESIYVHQQLEKSNDQVIIMNQNKNQMMYLEPQFRQQIFLPPLPTTTTPQESVNQQQLVVHDQVYPNITMPEQNSMIRAFKRRDQSPRVFNEVLQEELTDDKWAWQKYGQKSIKGSPFPRNYFKCSASNCKATKIIEKSPKNDKYFLVSYSDVHNHDPPPSRRSLALYNNISKRRLPKSINIVPKALKLNASSSSSSSKRAKRFKVDASPTAPKPEIKKNNEMVDDVVVENKGDIIEEEEITYDKIFMDFENSNKLYI